MGCGSMTLRSEMPATAAWIDALRAAFGKEGIDAAQRAGRDGVPGQFCIRAHDGRVIYGTPAMPGRVEIRGADMVIESKTRKPDNAARR